MFDLKVQTFNDGEGFFIGGQKRLRNAYGWYKGDELERWLGKLISIKTGNSDLSFRQLHELCLQNNDFKDLYVTSTNLSLQRAETFCHTTKPDMQIKTAVRISASVPLYFSATFLDSTGNIVRHPETSSNYQVYVDGGLLQNYPIDMFDSAFNDGADVRDAETQVNPKTLGLKLERPEQIEHFNSQKDIAPYKINNLKNYVGALYNIVIENLNRKQSFDDESFRTVYISTSNISPKVRKISTHHKQRLYTSGKEATEKFFHE
jgi:NTE family protein